MRRYLFTRQHSDDADVAVTGNATYGVEGHGGGIHAAAPLTMELSGATVSGNRVTGAGSTGAGLHQFAGQVTITDSVVAANTAEWDGGGIHVDSGGTLDVVRTSITDNSSNHSEGRLQRGWLHRRSRPPDLEQQQVPTRRQPRDE